MVDIKDKAWSFTAMFVPPKWPSKAWSTRIDTFALNLTIALKPPK